MRTLQIASMVPGTAGEPFGVQMKKATRKIFVKKVLVLEGTERDWWVIDPEGAQKAD